VQTAGKFTSADLVYRRGGDAPGQAATLYADDALESPTLPGFSCQVAKLFFTRPSS
jgi:hypothetical protein